MGDVVVWVVIGINLGGDMTPMDSPSSIIAVGVSEQKRCPISFNLFFKMGLGLTVLHFIISMTYLYLRFGLLTL